jgi:hypothetical protein
MQVFGLGTKSSCSILGGRLTVVVTNHRTARAMGQMLGVQSWIEIQYRQASSIHQELDGRLLASNA